MEQQQQHWATSLWTARNSVYILKQGFTAAGVPVAAALCDPRIAAEPVALALLAAGPNAPAQALALAGSGAGLVLVIDITARTVSRLELGGAGLLPLDRRAVIEAPCLRVPLPVRVLLSTRYAQHWGGTLLFLRCAQQLERNDAQEAEAA